MTGDIAGRSPPFAWLGVAFAVTIGALAVLVASFLPTGGPVSESMAGPSVPAAGNPPAPALAPSSASGTVGAAFTVLEAGAAYKIRLVRLAQRVTLIPYESPVNAADHIAAAQFTVTGLTGQAGDDPDLSAVAAGSDGAAYQPSGNDIAGETSLEGQFTVGPGQVQGGWVTFELPPGVTLTEVQWRPAFGTGAFTWTVRAGRFRGRFTGPAPLK